MVLNLCIDIGNSLIKLAVVEDTKILHKDVVEKIYVAKVKALRKEFGFENVIVGASGRLPKAMVRHLQQNYHLLILETDTKLPVEIAYKTPDTLGRDRIAAVVGASELLPGVDCAVIDIGTCVTYDVITKDRVFIGGNIAPGVNLRLKSMHDYTAKLPLVKRGSLSKLLGQTTEEALQNGATIGTLLEIESFIERIKKEFKKINIILTGGDAEFFAEEINSKIFVNPNLVLIGLNKIMNINA